MVVQQNEDADNKVQILRLILEAGLVFVCTVLLLLCNSLQDKSTVQTSHIRRELSENKRVITYPSLGYNNNRQIADF